MLLYDRFEQVPRDGKEALQLALLLHVESYLRESLNLSHELDQLTGLDLILLDLLKPRLKDGTLHL